MSVWLTLRQFFDRWNTNSPVVLFPSLTKSPPTKSPTKNHHHHQNIMNSQSFCKYMRTKLFHEIVHGFFHLFDINHEKQQLQLLWQSIAKSLNVFLKKRHLNWIWLPLSDRSSAIGKTENNIMINPFLLHLFAKPFSISLGSRLYPLPFDLYISLSFCLCIIYSTHKLYNIFVLEISSQEQE